MRIMIFNQKGGVGKTTTAINLGAALARAGQSVVVADLDPQMHLSAGLGLGDAGAGWTTAQWLEGQDGTPSEIESEAGLRIIPGTTATDWTVDEAALDMCGADWLLMDAPPVWSPRLGAIMAQCDIVLAPVEADFLGLQGINRLMRTMQDNDQSWDKLRFLLCRYIPRLRVHREVRRILERHFGAETVLATQIRNSVRLSEAPGQGISIFDHAPGTAGAEDYAALAQIALSGFHGEPVNEERREAG